MKSKKTWKEKLHDSKGLPKVEEIKGKLVSKWGEGTFVIPAPVEVDEIMKTVSKGKLITINEIRKFIAKKHKASIACPITTGIFSWIAAHAADEEEAAGKKRITPYWRTLKSNGELNPKYPGGIDNLMKRLEKEGYSFYNKGSKVYVQEFEKHLIKV